MARTYHIIRKQHSVHTDKKWALVRNGVVEEWGATKAEVRQKAKRLKESRAALGRETIIKG